MTTSNKPYSADNEDEWINGIQDERDNHENTFQRDVIEKEGYVIDQLAKSR